MNKRKSTIALTPPAGMTVDDARQRLRRWQEEQRFLTEQHPGLAERARKLGLVPDNREEPSAKH